MCPRGQGRSRGLHLWCLNHRRGPTFSLITALLEKLTQPTIVLAERFIQSNL